MHSFKDLFSSLAVCLLNMGSVYWIWGLFTEFGSKSHKLGKHLSYINSDICIVQIRNLNSWKTFPGLRVLYIYIYIYIYIYNIYIYIYIYIYTVFRVLWAPINMDQSGVQIKEAILFRKIMKHESLKIWHEQLYRCSVLYDCIQSYEFLSGDIWLIQTVSPKLHVSYGSQIFSLTGYFPQFPKMMATLAYLRLT